MARYQINDLMRTQPTLDVSAAYPTSGICFNASRETTSKELISVEGIDENTKRMQTINFSAGRVNAVEFCSTMYKLPRLNQLTEIWDHQHSKETA